MVILQRKVPFFQNLHFFVLIKGIKILIKIGKLVIRYDRYRPHLLDIICNKWVNSYIALECSLYVASQVWPRCISIGQIYDDFIRRVSFKLLFTSIVITYRVDGSLMWQIRCIDVLIFLGTLDIACSLDSPHIIHQKLQIIVIQLSIIMHQQIANHYLNQMIYFVTYFILRKAPMHDNRGSVVIGDKQVKSDQCLHQLLGNYIDIQWNIKTGVMRVSSTKYQSYSHKLNQDIEAFQYIPLKHGAHCPLLNENIVKNHQRYMRPCSVVLLENKETNTFLATQRPINISFGGKWVIPGGHLEIGQGIIEGGIRECFQEVGLNKEAIQQIKSDVMVWESVYTVNSEVKATGLVVFFRIQTKIFQVVAQKGEIQKWQWRKMEKGGEPWGDGWAQGHLTYLRFINQIRN